MCKAAEWCLTNASCQDRLRLPPGQLRHRPSNYRYIYLAVSPPLNISTRKGICPTENPHQKPGSPPNTTTVYDPPIGLTRKVFASDLFLSPCRFPYLRLCSSRDTQCAGKGSILEAKKRIGNDTKSRIFLLAAKHFHRFFSSNSNKYPGWLGRRIA